MVVDGQKEEYIVCVGCNTIDLSMLPTAQNSTMAGLKIVGMCRSPSQSQGRDFRYQHHDTDNLPLWWHCILQLWHVAKVNAGLECFAHERTLLTPVALNLATISNIRDVESKYGVHEQVKLLVMSMASNVVWRVDKTGKLAREMIPIL
jgi:hypothetical protein